MLIRKFGIRQQSFIKWQAKIHSYGHSPLFISLPPSVVNILFQIKAGSFTKIYYLKKVISFLFFICSNLIVHAQQDATAAALSYIQHIPPFKIFTAPDSTAFTDTQLKKDKPFVLMFFSPDCDHCQKEAKELLAYKTELKDVQIVMASPAAFSQIKGFYQEYNIASMPNIVMGQDLNYSLGSKYKLTTYPSLFVYDAAGKLAKAFVGNVGVPVILAALK